MPSRSNKQPVSGAAATLGERVRARREELGLSQERLAENTQLHWSYIGRVERGQNNLTLQSIVRLAAVLKVDPGELVAGLAPDWD